jgi:hypothetical protein
MAGRRGSSGTRQALQAAGLFAWALAKFLRELSPPFSSWQHLKHLKRKWQAALGTKPDKGVLILASNNTGKPRDFWGIFFSFFQSSESSATRTVVGLQTKITHSIR